MTVARPCQYPAQEGWAKDRHWVHLGGRALGGAGLVTVEVTGAVGLVTTPERAEAMVAQGTADLVLLARELWRDAYWPLRTAQRFGAEAPGPAQYSLAF